MPNIKHVHNVRLVILLLLFCGGYVFISHPFLSTGRYTHVSIDDVTECLQRLTKDSTKYSSLFEEPFFAYLKMLHDNYDCKITCYAFEQNASFNVCQMPSKYSKDFCANSDWLKIGFHGVKPTTIQQQKSISFKEYVDSYNRFYKELDRYASKMNKASILRLDRYYATQNEVNCLIKDGVKTLLSSDDDRRSYCLPYGENLLLINNNSLYFHDLKYLRTNIRIENIISPYLNVFKHKERDTLIVFTHEWKLDRITKYKLCRIVKILKEQNYVFICE